MSPLKRTLYVVLLTAVLAISAYAPSKRAAFAIRTMLSLRSLAAGSTAENLPVSEERICRRRGSGWLESLIYRPDHSAPDRAILLVPGISELGCYHPRLMAVSRSLAHQGFVVLTPDIRMFREFQIDPSALDEIVFWFEQVKTIDGGDKIRRLGMGGISFSGTLALIAAARPEIRDRVAYVLAMGPYDDPLRCTGGWFAAGPITVGSGYYPTRFYAKWIIMIAALDLLPDVRERRSLQSVLLALLLQKKVPEPEPGFSQEASRWYRLAVMREDQSDPGLTLQIKQHLTPKLYRPITPEEAAQKIHCPVFLVHGEYDDLIPSSESVSLRARLTKATTYLLVSPFLTHTHPLERPLGIGDRVAGAARIFVFFYHFAEVTSQTGRDGPFCYC